MDHRGFFACLLLCMTTPLWATEIEDNQQLHAQAQQYLQSALANEYVGVEPQNVKVAVANIDPRLRLSHCDTPVSHAIASPQPYGNNISLKVQCTGSSPWNIYLSAKVETIAAVAVISRSMNRGEVVGPADVELVQMNTAQAGFGYLSELEQVVGMELKRRLQAGTSLRLAHVTTPEVVKKGDKVLLEAARGGISVVTNAKALAAGQVGDQIRVVNSKSNREVDAVVVGPGRVQVLL